MAQKPDMDTLSNATVYSSGGDKIGSVGQVYLDNESDRPEWLTVKTGMFGTKETFIPLADAQVKGSDIHVPYDKVKVKDAPNIDADGALSPKGGAGALPLLRARTETAERRLGHADPGHEKPWRAVRAGADWTRTVRDGRPGAHRGT